MRTPEWLLTSCSVARSLPLFPGRVDSCQAGILPDQGFPGHSPLLDYTLPLALRACNLLQILPFVETSAAHLSSARNSSTPVCFARSAAVPAGPASLPSTREVDASCVPGVPEAKAV